MTAALAASLHDFDYDLPADLIAQAPPAERGGSRLLVLDRRAGSWSHERFSDLPRLVRPGDLFVLNETRVFPARLRARKRTGGKVEVLLLEAAAGTSWLALARPARDFAPGTAFAIEAGGRPSGFEVRALGREGERVVVEIAPAGQGAPPLGRDAVLELCGRAGETPLPPYIRREAGDPRRAADAERYQTVYARNVGAVAAPTAGLHFTEEVLSRVRDAGGRFAAVTLHVGLGTFQPLTEESFAAGTLHSEEVEVGAEAGEAIHAARREGRRVVAVGTTSVRAIESFLREGRAPYRGRTDLFIKPGYTFRGVHVLLTNFHLPRSSLLVLVSAFAGRELVLEAYREAVRERYRFYSFGDAMLIV